MNENDKIKSAEKFAQEKHKNQKRQDGVTTHIKHLEEVVYRLKNLGVTETDVLCAAWLHDTLEKTDTSLEEIIQRFDRKIGTLVLSLTKNADLPKKDMEKQYIKQLRNAPTEAKIIKLCDISSNIKDLSSASISNTQKNKKIRKILHYLRVIKSEISEEKSHYPRIQEMVDGINTVATKFRQRPVLI
jgi:(p)ppGpp synthase/HD superfamily hydrolase